MSFQIQLPPEATAEHPLAAEFEGTYPQEILKYAVDTYGERLALVTSFQPTGIATLHMLSQLTARLSILTLDTGLLFPETYRLIEEIENRFEITIKRISPALSLPEQTRREGINLWNKDPNACCHLRKTRPLQQALANYDAWLTGLRRDQSPVRANTPIISYDSRFGLVKICPFATWTEEMIWTYLKMHKLPFNPLHERGYRTIGCYTCTRTATGGDPRGGRWINNSKTECGIHVRLVNG